MPYPAIERLSPNRSATPPHEQRGVVFHHSDAGYDETISRVLRPGSKLSYHCLIAADGTQCTLVPDAQIAWHAGVSQFRGRGSCDNFMLGVAFAGDSRPVPLTSHQMASALEWLARRWTARGWTVDSVTDHRQVAAGSGNDLAPAEWARLHAAVAARFTP